MNFILNSLLEENGQDLFIYIIFFLWKMDSGGNSISILEENGYITTMHAYINQIV